MTESEKKLLLDRFGHNCCLADYELRLKSGEPLAYILGEWYFWDEVYTVNSSVLIPRPETELLAERLVKLLPPNGRFADLCTGSGCIAISSLKHRLDATAIAVDISPIAIETANINSIRNGTTERLQLLCADITNPDCIEGNFDIIVSNPPYIPTDVIPTLDTVTAEPLLALDGGHNGLRFYYLLLSEYIDHIKPGGYMLLEIGYDQAEPLSAMCGEISMKRERLGRRGFTYDISKDYSGNDRILSINIF